LAGGVVVGGYFARDSALGFLRFICLCRGLGVFGVSACGSSVSDLIQYSICDLWLEVVAIEGICILGCGSVCVSITSAFFSRFRPAIPASNCARLPDIPCVTSCVTFSRAEGCAQLYPRSKIHAFACHDFSPASCISFRRDSSCFLRAVSTLLPNSGLRCAHVRMVEGLTPTSAPAFSKVNPLPQAATISSAILSENISRPFLAFSIGALGVALSSSIRKTSNIVLAKRKY